MLREKPSSFRRALAADPLARAFVVSLMLHFIVIGGVEAGREAGLWTRSLLPESLRPRFIEEVQKSAQKREEQARMEEQRQAPEAELIFIDVDPSQAVVEPPKDAKFYSNKSTLAGNPETGEKDKPKIDGKQDKVPKTMDTLRPDPKAMQAAAQPKEAKVSAAQPLQPTPPEKKAETKPIEKPRPAEPRPPAEPAGETLLARATPRPEPFQPSNTTPPQPPQKKQHARTLAEAKANKGIVESPKMRQEGGVHRASLDPGFNVKETPFGTYDAKFIQAVQARWFSLLDQRDFVGSEAGRVVVEFRLKQDGRITNLRVVESGVSEVLSWFCQRSILDPAPYEPFPSDLRRMMDADYREIRFTFYYNQ